MPDAGKPKGRRVLVVEDDVTTRNALRSLLRASGHHVTCAGTIAEAMAALSGTVDTIILDLMLPDGDGTEVLRRVRTANLGVRVCVTTGVSSPVWLQRVQELKPDCVLRKPIDLATLLEKL